MYRKWLVALVTSAMLLGAGGFVAWYFELLSVREELGVGPRLEGPDATYSNILPADYVGPDACAKCHPKQHHRWSSHPHRFMNQLAHAGSIKGDFDNHIWNVRPGYSVTFSSKAGEYFIAIERPGQQRTRYRVTRTVGSRFVQYYIGVQTEGPEPKSDPRYTTEHKMPFGYWFRMKRWLPAEYFDIGEDREEKLAANDSLYVSGVDNTHRMLSYIDNCVHCHNTYPHAYRIFQKSLRGFPEAVLAPDLKALSAALSDKINVAANADAFADMPYKLDVNKDLVTVGISCESCHHGGREHALDKKDIVFFPSNPYLSVKSRTETRPFTGKRDNPATSQGICAQCHSATIAEHPNGARIRNSAEAADLFEGSCLTQIRCTNCHEPHTPGVPSGWTDPPKHLDACMNCHEKYSEDAQIAAHTRHDAKANVNCMDCHMPRITQGIDEVSRTHRISLPVEGSMISKGAPNACNLCHLDKSVRWTLDELKRGWGKTITPFDNTPAALLDQPAGKMWLKSARSIDRMIAVNCYARTGHWKENVADVLDSLNDVNPTNRAFNLFALERIVGRPLTVGEIDITAVPTRRSKQSRNLRPLLEKLK